MLGRGRPSIPNRGSDAMTKSTCRGLIVLALAAGCNRPTDERARPRRA